MSKKQLATFRIDESDWQSFQNLAKEHDTNASSALIKFIKACLAGSIDISLNELQLEESIDSKSLDKRIDINLDTKLTGLDERIDKKFNSLDNRIDSKLDEKLSSTIASVEEKFSKKLPA
ncbi:MAG: hypothetical protein ACRC11_03980 [Xenococcaceae cyanobacterium]